jgi:hypothetical protein
MPALCYHFPFMKHVGENVVRIEADALRALADRLAGPMAADFDRAVELMFRCKGRVVVTGMGKSGLIARKIAATLSSTGSPALYLHPVEAVHGDLGMIVRGDVVLALSASGETEEILLLLTNSHKKQRARAPAPHQRPRWRPPPMLLWTVRFLRRLVRSAWLLPLPPPRCLL